MTSRTALRTALAVVALATLLGIAGLIVRARAGDALHGLVSGHGIAAGLLLGLLLVGALGASIVARLPGNAVGWVFLATSLALSLGGFSEVYAVWGAAGRAVPLRGTGFANAIYEHGGAILWAPLFAILLLFPDGRPPPGRWRWLVPTTIVILSGHILDPALGLGLADWLWPAQTLALLLAAGALVARFRRARGVARQQLKWIAASGVLVMVGVTTMFLMASVGAGAEGGPWELVGPALIVAGFGSVPVAATIAITRYHLYDLDRLVSRASSYTLVIGLVIGIYVVSVMLVRLTVPAMSGSDLAVAGSTLLAAAVFSPLERRMRAAIDRRFHRQRYDAVQTIERLAERLRDEIDETALLGSVRAALTRTLAPAHISVWRP